MYIDRFKVRNRSRELLFTWLQRCLERCSHTEIWGCRQKNFLAVWIWHVVFPSCPSYCKQIGLFNCQESLNLAQQNVWTNNWEEICNHWWWEPQQSSSKLQEVQHTAPFLLLTALPLNNRNMLLCASFSNLH